MLKTLKWERLIGRLHWGITKFAKTLYIPQQHFHQSTPPRNVSETKGKITPLLESNQGHTPSANYKRIVITLTFFIPPSVRSLTSADYYANRLTHNTTVSAAGISPKGVPTEASCLAPIDLFRKEDKKRRESYSPYS